MTQSTLNMIAAAAAFLSLIALVPQVIKILKTRSARDLSFTRYVISLTGVALWSIYNSHMGLWIPFLGNITTIALYIFILVWKIREREARNEGL